MVKRTELTNCVHSAKGLVTNTPIISHTDVETLLGAVIFTDVNEMNMLSLGQAQYFATVMDQACRRVKAFHMKTKSEASPPLRRHDCWVERQSEGLVKRNVLDGRKLYLSCSNDLEADEVEISTAARNIPQENGRAERMRCTIKNAIQTLYIHAGERAGFWEKSIYNMPCAKMSSSCGGTKEPEEISAGVKP